MCATFLIIHIIKDIDTDNLKYAHIPKTRSNVVQQIQTPNIYILLKWTLCIRIIYHWMQWTAFPFMNISVGVGQKLKLWSSLHARCVLTQFFCLIHRSQDRRVSDSFLRSRKRSDPSCRSSRQTCSAANSLTFWSDAFILHWLPLTSSTIPISFISLCLRATYYCYFGLYFFCYLIKFFCKAGDLFIFHYKLFKSLEA